MAKKDYSKPFMVKEQFTPNEYVAICAMPAQYLYADAIKPRSSGFGYTTGADGKFQDERHFSGLLELLILLISAITGNTYETDGEYLGIRTTDSPSKKGTVTNFNKDYPVYGSVNQLSDGQEYSGRDLRGSVKSNGNEYYIQGNWS